MTGYLFQKFNDLGTQYIKVTNQIASLRKELNIPDQEYKQDDPEVKKKTAKLTQYSKQLDDITEQIQNIREGKNTEMYMLPALLETSPSIALGFNNAATFAQYVKTKTGNDINELSDTELKAIETKEKVMAEFKKGYENPLSFATAGELDETIDAYQDLIEKNELLVQLFNESNDIEWKEGHPFSQSFAEIIDGNVESAEELAEKSNDLVLTLNEMFEDVAESGGSLTEFFDEDMANAIQSLVDNTELIDLPFAEWPDQMKDTLAEVYNHFADFETNAKSMYISLQATNEEFYKQLKEDNA